MKKRRVLVIEDDRAVSGLLAHILQGREYEVAAAYDGLDGLSQATSFRPDLILLDVNIPRLDGWKVLDALKASPRTAGIPVLMCTEHTMMKEIEQALVAGARGCIAKPFTAGRVLAKVAETLAAVQ